MTSERVEYTPIDVNVFYVSIDAKGYSGGVWLAESKCHRKVYLEFECNSDSLRPG